MCAFEINANIWFHAFIHVRSVYCSMMDQVNCFASGYVSSIQPRGWVDTGFQCQVAEEVGKASHHNLKRINTIGLMEIKTRKNSFDLA